MIDVLVPVLSRPGNAKPLFDSLSASGADASITFICTNGDNAQIAACEATGTNVLVVDWKAGPGDYARKINHGFTHTQSEFVFMGADDIEFTPGWADVAIRMMRGRIGVVATNDMANREVMRGQYGTHNLILRSYIMEEGGTVDNEPGVVLWEGYDHQFVDRELCDVARARRRYTFAKRSVVRHNHPVWRTAQWDTTYRKAFSHTREDQVLYMQRSPLFNKRKRDIIGR